jgi:hypothetical protein
VTTTIVLLLVTIVLLLAFSVILTKANCHLRAALDDLRRPRDREPLSADEWWNRKPL